MTFNAMYNYIQLLIPVHQVTFIILIDSFDNIFCGICYVFLSLLCIWLE